MIDKQERQSDVPSLVSPEPDHPTKNDLIAAITMAKASPHNLTSTDIKCDDDATGIVRFNLPPRFNAYPLGTLRRDINNLSRSSDEPGKHKRTPRQKAELAINRLGNAFERNGEHSPEYAAIHASDEFRTIREGLKEATGFRCQLCYRHLPLELEGHIIDYERWNEPGMMLLLCRSKCHPVADSIRRWGINRENEDNEAMPLFGDDT